MVSNDLQVQIELVRCSLAKAQLLMVNCVYRGKGDYHRLGHGVDEHVRRPKKVMALQGKKIIAISTGNKVQTCCQYRIVVLNRTIFDAGALHCVCVSDQGLYNL